MFFFVFRLSFVLVYKYPLVSAFVKRLSFLNVFVRYSTRSVPSAPLPFSLVVKKCECFKMYIFNRIHYIINI